MPSRHDKNDSPFWLQPRQQLGAIPVVQRISKYRALSFSPGFDRIIDQHQVSAPPGNRPMHASREIRAAIHHHELAGRPAFIRNFQAEAITIVTNDAPNTAAKMICQRRSVGRCNDLTSRRAG